MTRGCYACDNMTVALKLLANLQEKENFTEVMYEGRGEQQTGY